MFKCVYVMMLKSVSEAKGASFFSHQRYFGVLEVSGGFIKKINNTWKKKLLSILASFAA